MTGSWSEFEEYTYYLIRGLGIHITHRFEPSDQRENPTGFSGLEA